MLSADHRTRDEIAREHLEAAGWKWQSGDSGPYLRFSNFVGIGPAKTCEAVSLRYREPKHSRY